MHLHLPTLASTVRECCLITSGKTPPPLCKKKKIKFCELSLGAREATGAFISGTTGEDLVVPRGKKRRIHEGVRHSSGGPCQRRRGAAWMAACTRLCCSDYGLEGRGGGGCVGEGGGIWDGHLEYNGPKKKIDRFHQKF